MAAGIYLIGMSPLGKAARVIAAITGGAWFLQNVVAESKDAEVKEVQALKDRINQLMGGC